MIAIEKFNEINHIGSVDDNCLIAIATYDRPRQKIIGYIKYIFKEVKPGSVIITIPTKPPITASPLYNPICLLHHKDLLLENLILLEHSPIRLYFLD